MITSMPNRLPEALLNPAVYPHRPEAVELRETHISWVLLAGEEVYKVKKPVSFPFLDYGSLERRRAFCHAEVALNRRFAPAIYRGVVAFVQDGESLRVGAEDDPGAVEYAVAMRRYDESATLAAEVRDVAAVGAAVAAWHAAAPVADGDGGLDGVVDETLDTLAQAGAPPPPGLARFCRAALGAFAPVLAQRARSGLVRDGHGDLRAEHILPGEPVQAVDGVEFDPQLRIADVGYDFAFLVMDLAGLDDERSHALVRAYREAGGDPGPDALLAFFCCLRALIRAKVDILRSDQLTGAAAQERRARGEDRLALAERFAWRARLPPLVCVTGLPASGKSTLAQALGAAAGRTVLGSDRVRKQRAGVAPHERAAPTAYGDAESRAVYTELAERATALVRERGGAIVEATFRRAADREAFTAAGSYIVCEAPPEVLLERARARARGPSVSDADAQFVAGELATYRGPFEAPGPELARLQTTRPVEELLEELAATLDARL